MTARTTGALRRSAVDRLALQLGDHVLDLGCGTGLSLPLLHEAVGQTGRVYGVDASPEMLERARARVARAGWNNIRLIDADAESFELPEQVHGILCFFTHDIMLSEVALPRAGNCLVPEGRIVAAGVKLSHGWLGWLMNPITVAYSLPATTNRDVERSFRPFAVLDGLLETLQVDEPWLGSHYLASGKRRSS